MSVASETVRNPPAGTAPLRVAALVDLAWGPAAGGHVKCWERIAGAVARHGAGLDLTVHFSGTESQVHAVADNVRYVVHRPVFSTARLPFLSHVPDHTDLSPWHPGLAWGLAECDVIHTTDAFFAFARTAPGVARRRGVPLVNSIHTDTPGYSRMYTAETVRRHLGEGRIGRLLLERLRVHERAERGMLARLARHQRQCAYALVSRPEERERALAVLPPERVRLLRRGIDRDLFNPARRDRVWLEEAFGVPRDRFLVLYVGRLNLGKNVMVLARAVRDLIDQGRPLHLFGAGQGEDRPTIRALLGKNATCPGAIEPAVLARIYACADAFAMPSEIEVLANVVMEALAAGTPPLVAARGGMGRLLRPGETGLVVGGDGPEPWAEAIASLVDDPERRLGMAGAARRSAERDLPSWDDILMQDLLPVWRAAVAEAAAGGVRP